MGFVPEINKVRRSGNSYVPESIWQRITRSDIVKSPKVTIIKRGIN
ncbi:hypothetical protein ACR9GP_25325 [Enterobacter ludwigii]